MKSKLISIPYTVAMIKPHVALQENKVSASLALWSNSFFFSQHRSQRSTKLWSSRTSRYSTRSGRSSAERKCSTCSTRTGRRSTMARLKST